MRRVHHLLLWFKQRARFIDLAAHSPLPNVAPFLSSCPPAHQLAGEMSLVDLQDTWSRFCRICVLTSAVDGVVTTKGRTFASAPGITSLNDALVILAALYPKRVPEKEPHWYVAAEVLRAANALKLANYADISLALAGAGVFSDIRTVRNYWAHKTTRNASLVKALLSKHYGIVGDLDFSKVLVPRVPSGRSLLGLWIDELVTVAEWMCE